MASPLHIVGNISPAEKETSETFYTPKASNSMANIGVISLGCKLLCEKIAQESAVCVNNSDYRATELLFECR